MAEFPAMPLFTDALIADTTHLTGEEFGCYMRLLIFCWRTPDCRLPNDDLRLRTMLGQTPKKWARMKPVLMQFFIEDGDTLLQKKLSKVRRAVSKSVEQKRAAGKRSWEARSLKKKNTGRTAASTGNIGALERGGEQPKPNLSKDRGEGDFFVFWEERIKEGNTLPQNALTASQVREIIKRGNVTAEQLKKSSVQT